jgi:hypothetical protein
LIQRKNKIMANNQKTNEEDMTSQVYLDKEGIIHVESIGLQTEDEALKVRKKVMELGKKVPGKVRILNNLTRMTKATARSRKTTAESIKLPEIGKVASFGGSTFAQVVASFIIQAPGMENKVKYFKTGEEALKWLREA